MDLAYHIKSSKQLDVLRGVKNIVLPKRVTIVFDKFEYDSRDPWC